MRTGIPPKTLPAVSSFWIPGTGRTGRNRLSVRFFSEIYGDPKPPPSAGFDS
jgi:hypothetical protein